MNTTVTQRWIAAGKLIAADPNAKVSCPVCGEDYLSVEDVRSKEDTSVIERTMRCQSCGAVNSLRLVRPE